MSDMSNDLLGDYDLDELGNPIYGDARCPHHGQGSMEYIGCGWVCMVMGCNWSDGTAEETRGDE